MATRRDETDRVKKKAKAAPAGKPAPARKAAPRKKPAASKAAAAGTRPAQEEGAATPASAKGLLRAGLKALGNVRDDVVKHQTHVIESLLGIGKTDAAGGSSAPARGFPGLDTFGIRKFEDVFDQRVATSLQRLGMPSAQEFQELREQMRLLLERVERIESGRRKR